MSQLALTSGRLRVVLIAPFLLAVMAMSLLGGVAFADYVYQSGWTYVSNEDCTWNRSEVSHGGGGGYSKVTVEAHWREFGVNCFGFFVRPAGYLAAKWEFWRWNSGTQGWDMCTYSDWNYNDSQAYSFEIYHDFGANPPCGSGYYGTNGGGYEYNGGWKGGWLWSGNHVLPP